ncbi:hypothetical protein Lspi_2259 [Legionella spiritensis]|uniref:Uncharacterized protein n=2 Tax=Legionella spiritensis TaxID=452 RepID=A0A0W0YXK6_LEGSP|nr:hypothetical protein Lspi_2259 [Legionella spiritensis]SNV39302.1 Uncharacterised protein [Legionella spiritensis]
MSVDPIKDFNEKLRSRLSQLETILENVINNANGSLDEHLKNLNQTIQGIVQILGEYSTEAAEKANGFLQSLLKGVTSNQVELVAAVDRLLNESNAWRKIVENVISSGKSSAIAFGRSTGKSLVYTSAAAFFGTFGRRTAKYLGYSEDTLNKVEFASSAVGGTLVAVASKATQLRPDAIALRLASYLSLPVIKKGLELGGCDSQQALLYAVSVQTLVDCYSDPVKGISTTAGFFVGNYAGQKIGSNSADAIANLFYGPGNTA